MRNALLAGLIAFLGCSLLAWADGLTVPFNIPATACTNQFIRSIAVGTGVGTCASITSADIPAGIINAKSILALGNTTLTTANTTQFFNTVGFVAAAEAGAEVPVRYAFTADGITVKTAAAPSTSQTYVYTLRKNLADTTITCTITDPARTCSDTTHTVSFAANDTIDVKVVSSTTANANYHMATTGIIAASP